MHKSIAYSCSRVALFCSLALLISTAGPANSRAQGSLQKSNSNDASQPILEEPNKAQELKDRIESVVRNASPSVVSIKTQGAPGSGSIVSKEGHTYTVLTAAHVVGGSVAGDSLIVRTADGAAHKAIAVEVSQWLDLATIRFESTSNYQVLPIADSSGGIVVALGYPIGSSELGFVPSITTVGSSNLTSRDGGYIFSYVTRVPALAEWGWMTDTLRGMSGGPVVDLLGQLVAVHGEADRFVDPSARGHVQGSSSSGLSLGIPSSAWRVVAGRLASYSRDAYLREFGNQDLTVDDLRLQASRKASEGHRQEAIQIWTEIIRMDPGDGSNYANRALLRSDLHDETGALRDYDTAVKLFPDSWQIYALRGDTRSVLGDHMGAQNDFNRSLSINRSYFRAAMLKMRDYTRAGRAQEAIKTGQYYLRDLDLSANGAFLIGSELIRAYAQNDQEEQALVFGLKLAEAHPSEPMLSIQLAELYLLLRRPQDALARLRRDLPRFSTDHQYVYRLSELELDYGSPAMAANLFTRLLVATPKDSVLHAAKCYALVKAKNPDDAITSCHQALQINPAYHLAYRYLGLALNDKGSNTEAELSYSNSLKYSNPKSAIDYLNRGETRWKLGRSVDACKDFRLAQSADLVEKQTYEQMRADWDQKFIDHCKH